MFLYPSPVHLNHLIASLPVQWKYVVRQIRGCTFYLAVSFTGHGNYQNALSVSDSLHYQFLISSESFVNWNISGKRKKQKPSIFSYSQSCVEAVLIFGLSFPWHSPSRTGKYLITKLSYCYHGHPLWASYFVFVSVQRVLFAC